MTVEEKDIMHLSKGQLVFKEGDKSTAMFYLKSGQVRIYKKKGTGTVELDTIHPGQLLGELAFLDGNPRSAFGEALTDCSMIVISKAAFEKTLSTLPIWVKSLLSTVVARLRAASSRIKQLESTVSTVNYSNLRPGQQPQQARFFSNYEIYKLSLVCLMLFHKHKNIQGKLLKLISHQLLSVPLSKMIVFVDILTQNGLMTTDDPKSPTVLQILDPQLLEDFLFFLHNHYADPEKVKAVSTKGLKVMELICADLQLKSPVTDDKTVTFSISNFVASHQSDFADTLSFKDFHELAILKYCTSVKALTEKEVTTTFSTAEFLKNFRFQSLLRSFADAKK